MKNILLTGARRGLGLQIKEALIQQKNYVFGTSSRWSNGKREKNFTSLELDYTKSRTLHKLIESLEISKRKVDVVIHNAGIAYLELIYRMSTKEVKQTFDINFFGPIELTRLLIPQLRQKTVSHIIFISSIVSVDHWPYLGAYAASKAALDTAAFELACTLKKWNINVSIIRPNPLPTNMEMRKAKKSDYDLIPSDFKIELHWERVQDVCAVIKEIISENDPHFEHVTGDYSKNAIEKFHKQNSYQSALEEYRQPFLSA